MSYVGQAVVIEMLEHSAFVREYVIELEKERKYNPGSFVQLSLELVNASDIWPESRTFSIASYEKRAMRFIIKKSGSYTSKIFDELCVGKKCTVKYPFGDLFKKETVNEKHLFIAGGLGITPFLGIIQFMVANGYRDNASLLYSAKYFQDIIHYDILKSAFGEQMELFITREKIAGSHNHRISLDDIMRTTSVDSNVYICGSKEFIKYYSNLLNVYGFRKIHVDEWE